MGFFFLGAISTSIARGMKQNIRFRNKSFIKSLKNIKRKDKLPDEDK